MKRRFLVCIIQLAAWIPLAGARAGQNATDVGGLVVTIDQAVSLAVARDERARAAGVEVEAAHERVQRARAFFFPELNVTATYSRRPRERIRTFDGNAVVIQQFNALAGMATLSIPIFDARSFPLYRQALLEHEAATLSAAEQRRLVGFESADAFLMVLGAQEVVRAAQRRLVFSEARYEDARARALAGLVSSNNVTRSKLELANAQRQVVVATSNADLARLELSYLVAAPVSDQLQEPTALLAAAAGVDARATQPLIERGQRDRLDVKAADKQVQALQESALEPRRRMYPSLSLVGQGRYTNEAGFTGRNFDGLASLMANWNLFDGGERYAEGKERDAIVRAASLTQERRRRSVTVDVRRALISLENARATQVSARLAAEVAETHGTETAELYGQGLTGALEVADATLRRFEADVTLVQDRYALGLAYLDLRAATGDPAVDGR